MMMGSGILCWRHASASWPLIFLGVAVLLFALAVLWPIGYSPIDHALHRLQHITVQLFSWVVLLIVFMVIFVPGHFLLGRRWRRSFRNEKADTYWIDVSKQTFNDDFQAQF